MPPRRPSAPTPPTGLRRALCLGVDVPPRSWDELAARLVRRDVRKGERLLELGSVSTSLHFLELGIVRYVVRDGDREVNLGFDCEGRIAGDLESLVARAPAARAIEALTDVVEWRIPYDELCRLAGAHPEWGRVRTEDLERFVRRRSEKERRIRTRTPGERYAALVREGSYLVRRVPQFHLASYLGVTPETLSRIRARS